ncbi:MAG TPA: hypothetical protein VGE20_14650 [Ramlibacter sp.]
MLSALFATDLRPLRKIAAALSLPVAAALGWIGPAHAGQAVERFDVSITVTPAAQSSSVCTTLKAPADESTPVAVVCGPDVPGAPGSPPPGQQVGRGDGYRVLTRGEELAAGIDGYGGAIATTAVRVVNLPGRQYIEMTVGW